MKKRRYFNSKRPGGAIKAKALIAGLIVLTSPVMANTQVGKRIESTAYNLSNQYSASFQNADIKEFINTVSSNLNRTIIVDPTVRANITVRSYDTLNEQQYYQFFLNVLQVHGFAVIEEANGILKVVRDKDAKTSAIPVIGKSGTHNSDEMVTWVLPVNNVPVRELSPLLRQLINTSGNVVHYDPSNVLLMTGRAGNLERLAEVVRRIDKAGAESVSIVPLKYASAAEMERILVAIYGGKGRKTTGNNPPIIVSNERTNQMILSGDRKILQRMKHLTLQLDAEQESSGNTRVFYLKYAKAEDIKPVLEGVSKTVQAEKQSNTVRKNPSEFSIEVHEQTNAVVVSARQDIMQSVEKVIKQLDIRRAQVLVEAVIVEVAEGDGINLGVQFANEDASTIMQFHDGGVPIGQMMLAKKEAEDTESIHYDENGRITQKTTNRGDYSKLSDVMNSLSGAALSIAAGDFSALIQAVTSAQNSNVLATPSLMTLDNHEATFMVGEDVPTLTGSQASSNGNSNPYQTVDRKKVGTMLKITPQINEGDAVILNLEQENSYINGTTPVDIKFAERKITTSVQVKSGETIVLGGLISEQVKDSVSKIPLLGDIPILGHLFRSTNSKKEKSNLMVFIRPTIIRSDDMITAISGRKYSLMRAAQLDKRERGVPLMPNALTPILPEKANNGEAWFKKAREHMGQGAEPETIDSEASKQESASIDGEDSDNDSRLAS
ncbi:type II secretion system secretin GspD [Endozoicomonas sp. Mp262]|uniref:type II secretion system secretin GspD n=1 Tax=Endozoicomonas sp. Mp262 TaxID=2919499 RepID=UPI0021D928E7